MGRRLSAKVIAELEEKCAQATGTQVSKVFGICDLNRHVLRCWRLTLDGPQATDDPPELMIPDRLEKLLWPKREIIIWGGRGSAKTRTIVSILTERARIFTERIACFREIQDSIADSSYQEIVDEIERHGMDEGFSVTERKIRSRLSNGSFNFSGLFRNQTKVKGKAGSTVAWVEEAENVSRTSWDILKPTIRAPGSQIIVSLNPREETDPTWADLIAPYWDKAVDGIYEDEHRLIIQCNHTHNPWLTAELSHERDTLARVDPDRYAWIWEGMFRKRSDVKVLNGKWIIDAFEPGRDWDGPYFGADFGFSQDPSTLVKMWINNRKLYVEYEAYGVGIELDDMPRFYDAIPGAREHKIYADNARPETISHIKHRGFNIEAADKWPGSVEDGIIFLRSFEQIVIHPRCANTAKEANLWQYKTDRLTGDILPALLDGNEHCIAEGQLVTTARGEIPIEQVQVGDWVLTRDGYKPVLMARQTDSNREVLRIHAGGKSVVCTPDHQIFVVGKGFVRADTVRYNDEVIIIEECSLWSRLSAIKARITGAIRTILNRV